MMRRGFTVLIVGSVNSPFRGMTKLRATIWDTSGIGSFSGAATCICAAN